MQSGEYDAKRVRHKKCRQQQQYSIRYECVNACEEESVKKSSRKKNNKR